jgi:ubiquinone/menaquinone biosynthesis C-methylase UbiE
MPKPTKSSQGYLHGFSKGEQGRLYQQAKFLENKVYERIDLRSQTNLLEIGCGVGAQTEILLKRFPNLTITGVDASKAQLKQANAHLKSEIARKKVTLLHGDAGRLPFADSTFDSVFICWLLEHVSSPLAVLKEVARTLQSGGLAYCTEVMNSSLYLHPYSPATLQYWFAFNDHQMNLQGDPYVGAKLGHYLQNAGFQDIVTKEVTFHYDSRAPKMRSLMFEYWTNLLLSGAPEIVGGKHVSQKLVDSMRGELAALKKDPEAVFYYSAMQAQGRVY